MSNTRKSCSITLERQNDTVFSDVFFSNMLWRSRGLQFLIGNSLCINSNTWLPCKRDVVWKSFFLGWTERSHVALYSGSSTVTVDDSALCCAVIKRLFIHKNAQVYKHELFFCYCWLSSLQGVRHTLSPALFTFLTTFQISIVWFSGELSTSFW